MRAVQDNAIRAVVFAMPDTSGQVPAIFAVAPPPDAGNNSDCECVAVTNPRKASGRAIELR